MRLLVYLLCGGLCIFCFIFLISSSQEGAPEKAIIYGPGSFETDIDLKAWEKAYGVRAVRRVTGLVTHGKFCVRLAYPEGGGGNFRLADGYFRTPGRIKNLSSYEALVFDVKNGSEFPVEVGIRIKGGGFDAIIYKTPIPSGQVANLVYKLKEIAHLVDVTYINYFGILCKNEANKEAVIFVDNLRLIRSSK